MYTIKLTPERMAFIRQALELAIYTYKGEVAYPSKLSDEDAKACREMIMHWRLADTELGNCKED